jgi:hypothetical protein
MENEFDDLLESNKESLEAEFDKIRDTKLHEILTCLKSLYVIINAFIQYKYEEDTDFSSMIKLVNDSLTSEEESEKIFHYFGISDNLGSDQFNNYYKQIFETIVSPEYKPPTIVQDIYDQVLTLYFHYSEHYLKHGYLLWDLRIDLILSNIMTHANMSFQEHIRIGNRDLARTKKTTKVKQMKSNIKRGWVYKIYSNSSKIGVEIKLHTVAGAIEKEFKKLQKTGTIQEDIKAPGIHQIENYLRGNDKIIREFERVGRYLVKKI